MVIVQKEVMDTTHLNSSGLTLIALPSDGRGLRGGFTTVPFSSGLFPFQRHLDNKVYYVEAFHH